MVIAILLRMVSGGLEVGNMISNKIQDHFNLHGGATQLYVYVLLYVVHCQSYCMLLACILYCIVLCTTTLICKALPGNALLLLFLKIVPVY